ncbi:hypothetical protein Q2T40_14150 [Winogradskyella maritima]|uniref:Dolichyl-phosphate-mannose-protein mannosyltransferase n=1 Tax=Winogradskyella maritima TaxID=1517766 RepID=A0ABV8AGJ2_9FLAO|nr:hypothetical protein [Winogradskyella maritima]
MILQIKTFLEKREQHIYSVVFAVSFILLLFKGPIVTDDTNSYLNAEISRFPGYVICINLFRFVFQSYFEYVLVAFQLILGFCAIRYALKTLGSVFNLNVGFKLALFVVLLSPYFQSIYVANNLTSEGLAFPFYIVFICSSLQFIFHERKNLLWLVATSFILLCLTRGQFIVCSLIIAFIYGLKHRKKILSKEKIMLLAVLLLLPLSVKLLDKTYRYLAYDQFVSTPYSYVNAVALPLFVSEKHDSDLFNNEDDKAIFKFAYARIDSLNLLSSKVKGQNMYTEPYFRYMRFHNDFPLICNQNIHSGGVHYYIDKGFTPAESYIKTEQTSKNLMWPLIKSNFKEYATLYAVSIAYGIKSIPLLIIIIILGIWAFSKSIKEFTALNGLVMLTVLLVVSNATIVAVACHSISRYLFYNDFMLLLAGLVLLHQLIMVTND